MNPGDMIILGKKVWEVTGVYLGGTGTQDLIGVKSVTSKPGYSATTTHKEMFVPIEFFEKMNEVNSVLYSRQ